MGLDRRARSWQAHIRPINHHAKGDAMPLVRIAVPANVDPAGRRKISEAVHRALVDTIEIPLADRFHIVTSHAPEDLVYDPSYLNVSRSPGFVAIHITLRRGRTAARKRALYRAIVDNVHDAAGIRIEDVMIVLSENEPIDWSFGGGVAQYAPDST
jgi:phenylpyruvate tautomerase PptA (4-oxalocrotonate tautomerase family)